MLIRRNGRWLYSGHGNLDCYKRKPPYWLGLALAIFAAALIIWLATATPRSSAEVKTVPSFTTTTIITVTEAKPIVIDARITGFSPADSCHNPDGKGGCLAANGRAVKPGDIACPHWLKLGTKVRYLGVTYTCNDRPADWVQQKWVRTPTFDIYRSSCAKGACGLAIGKIEIIAE